MYFVKTVYSDGKPNITRYRSEDTAKGIIRAYKEHGIDIVSCELIDQEKALAEVRAQKVEYDRA
jgi:hypothetical protein